MPNDNPRATDNPMDEMFAQPEDITESIEHMGRATIALAQTAGLSTDETLQILMGPIHAMLEMRQQRLEQSVRIWISRELDRRISDRS